MERRQILKSALALGLVGSTAMLSGCGIYGIGLPGDEEVRGRWVEEAGNAAPAAPAGTDCGVVFDADGRASSFGYENYEVRSFKAYRGVMELRGVVRSDSGRELAFVERWTIEEANAERMTLREGLRVRRFRRAGVR
ncbi:lipocalin family protein [Sutterella megalosphaeroides]|uniref:Lipoprotein n=1 Tax=Sutterella megalosphaeroides TaxID=2494234 RepID=A0A2Z6IBE1_9BURK|nr:lipocalin family protein [Sutterella megalosphaeroides]BBF23803.1 hypothetical protein SUTMEG_16940 [Sutterella megalosphaeroides]